MIIVWIVHGRLCKTYIVRVVAKCACALAPKLLYVSAMRPSPSWNIYPVSIGTTVCDDKLACRVEDLQCVQSKTQCDIRATAA